MGGPYTVKVINTLCVQEKERKKSDLCSSCRTEKTSTNHANSARKSKNQLDSFRSSSAPAPSHSYLLRTSTVLSSRPHVTLLPENLPLSLAAVTLPIHFVDNIHTHTHTHTITLWYMM